MPEVKCYPEPDAFNPCEDVMGNNLIRFIACGVTGAAIVGNMAVIVVLIRFVCFIIFSNFSFFKKVVFIKRVYRLICKHEKVTS